MRLALRQQRCSRRCTLGPELKIQWHWSGALPHINGRIEKIDFSYEDKKQIEIIEDSYTNDKSENNNSLIDLNIALSNKHFKILIKKDYSLKKPLIIYHLSNEKMKSKNINLRLDFELEQNSSLKLIDFFSDDSEKNFMNILFQTEHYYYLTLLILY